MESKCKLYKDSNNPSPPRPLLLSALQSCYCKGWTCLSSAEPNYLSITEHSSINNSVIHKIFINFASQEKKLTEDVKVSVHFCLSCSLSHYAPRLGLGQPWAQFSCEFGFLVNYFKSKNWEQFVLSCITTACLHCK